MNKACKTVLQAKERIERLKQRNDLYYDPIAAEKPIKFIESYICLHDAEWNGKPFILTEWQKEDILRPLFGFKYKKNGFRLFKEAYIQLPKGTGKSALNAAILLYLMIFGGKGLSLYCVGTSRETAKTVFNDVLGFLNNSPKLKDMLLHDGNENVTTIWTNDKKLGYKNILKYLSSVTTFDGPRPSVVSFDEYHRHKKADLYNIFQKSLVKRNEALMLTITNAGTDLFSPCYLEYKRAKKILSGEVEDDRYFCYVPEPDEDDEWDKWETVQKVSPNLGYNIVETDIKRDLQTATEFPEKVAEYRRYNLNQWVQGTKTPYIDYGKWIACKRVYTEADLHGNKLWLACDLSFSGDLTTLTGFVLKDGLLYTVSRSYLPKKRIFKSDNKEASFKEWYDNGYLKIGDPLIETGQIDYEYIFEEIQGFVKDYNFQCIAFDPNFASSLKGLCEKNQINYIDVPQRPHIFTDPIMEFRRNIYEKKIVHNDNPLFNWCLINTNIEMAGKLAKLVKESETARIDPIVAAVMALYSYQKGYDDSEDIYSAFMNMDSNFRLF